MEKKIIVADIEANFVKSVCQLVSQQGYGVLMSKVSEHSQRFETASPCHSKSDTLRHGVNIQANPTLILPADNRQAA